MADYDFSTVDSPGGNTPPPEGQPKEQGQSPPQFDFSGVDSVEKNQGIGPTLIAAEEALERGMTGGISDVYRSKIEPLFLPKSLQTPAEDIQGRRESHPDLSTLMEIGGTGALLSATGGLGLAAPEGSGLLLKMASNAAQGSLISAANSVSNDMAFGDPNLAASKILSHAGTAAMWGGLFGGVGSAVVESAQGAKALAGLTKTIGGELPSTAPEALGPLDKFRIGLFAGADNPEAKQQIAQRVSDGLNSLHDLTSVGNLSDLGATGPEVEAFEGARNHFLKEFGDSKTGKIDPNEVLSYITSPASKTSTARTIAFNNYFKSMKGLSNIKLNDSALNKTMQNSLSNLNDWENALSDYASQGPHVDIEYDSHARGEERALSSKYDTFENPEKLAKAEAPLLNEEGDPIAMQAPSGQGVGIGAGESYGRVGSYGNERVSPFEYKGPSLDEINKNIGDAQEGISKAQENINKSSELNQQLESSQEKIKTAGNQAQNLASAQEAFQKAPAPLGAAAGYIASHIPGGGKMLALYSAIRNYCGDGGAYRLGKFVASHQKVINGVANSIQKVDDRILNGARLIFTGASSQARKIGEQK